MMAWWHGILVWLLMAAGALAHAPSSCLHILPNGMVRTQTVMWDGRDRLVRVTSRKVCGPDLNGKYGGLQGVGGLEKVESYAGTAALKESRTLKGDVFGNVLGTVEGGWSSFRVSAYGPVPGYSVLPLASNVSLSLAVGWRGKWMDPTGMYQIGQRPYDPTSRRFLSFDPLGHGATPDGFSAFNSDPVNYFDPDGRFGKGIFQGLSSGGSANGSSSAFNAGYWLGGVYGSLNEGWNGGEQILANTFTFGGTDALGCTDTSQLQGADYTGSRILATIGRESLIAAATLGTAQLARGGTEAALYGYQGLMAANTARSGWAVGAGIDQVGQGNDWGYLSIAGGTLGLAGGFALAATMPELNALSWSGEAAAEGGSLLPVKYDPVFALEQGANPATAVPDIYTVVRGGQTPIPPAGTVFSGSMGGTLSDAAAGVPHGTISATTAGAIRAEGGSVILAPEATRSGTINWIHVNVTEGGPTVFGPKIPNPVPKPGRMN